MRVGTGRIHMRTPNKRAQDSLSQITNHAHTKSQASSEKCEKQTCFQSAQSAASQKLSRSKQNNNSIFTDQEVIEHDEADDAASMVRKLTSLNKIFKELKLLKQSQVPFHVLRALSKVEDKFIAVERDILKSTNMTDRSC